MTLLPSHHSSLLFSRFDFSQRYHLIRFPKEPLHLVDHGTLGQCCVHRVVCLQGCFGLILSSTRSPHRNQSKSPPPLFPSNAEPTTGVAAGRVRGNADFRCRIRGSQGF